MSNLYYDSDDALPPSPGLQPVKPKATPSPSRPPVTTQRAAVLSRRRRRRQHNTRPSQGDTVLMNYVSPDHPDIAWIAAQSLLNSTSEASGLEDDKTFKEAESPNTIDDFSSFNRGKSGDCIVMNMEPKSNTAQDVDCLSTCQKFKRMKLR